MPVDSDVHHHDPEVAPSAELAAALGVVVVPQLLELALTHRSFAFERGGIPHNERLEFLGDSVLGQAVTVMLYTEHPDLDEGQLAKRRAALVSTVALAEIARGIGLGRYIHLGRGERLTGGSDKDSILADTLEAVIGATFLTSGGDVARDLVLRLVAPLQGRAERFGAAMDPKTALQEVATAQGGGAPVYEVEGTGPDHDRRYRAVVTVPDARGTGSRGARLDAASAPVLARGEGEGTSKKTAEMAAALMAWGVLAGVDGEGDGAAGAAADPVDHPTADPAAGATADAQG